MNNVKSVEGAAQEKFVLGSIWKASDSDIYILAYSGSGYSCINLATGNYWDDPVQDMENAVKGLTLFTKKAEITVKPIE